MTLFSELVDTSKPHVRQLADRPHKPHRHRYERRKIREYLRLADWTEEAA
ncbi:MAG: hypothetical protein NTW03_01885 [Verrucomicrobia bacterium]|nr:hypothetical protein [Verrucomicrobiota bacterium]